MKITTIIVFIGALFLLTACPGAPRESALKRLQENGMDFPDLQLCRYGAVKFQLSGLFDRDFGMGYTLQDNALGYIIYELDINFSVERFERDDVDMIQYSFDDDISAIDAVHDNYILKRESSLEDGQTGIKKELPKSVKFPGFVQVVDGASSTYSQSSSYFTATLKIQDEYYVFQLIGKSENMGYLYDDFIDILSSVKM